MWFFPALSLHNHDNGSSEGKEQYRWVN